MATGTIAVSAATSQWDEQLIAYLKLDDEEQTEVEIKEKVAVTNTVDGITVSVENVTGDDHTLYVLVAVDGLENADKYVQFNKWYFNTDDGATNSIRQIHLGRKDDTA